MTVLDETGSAPEPVTVKRWRCPFCRRTHSSRPRAAAHIARCWRNPAVRACKTCTHLEPGYDACGCGPGCNWGSPSGPAPESCAAGLELDGTIRSGCPLWVLRSNQEDGEA